MNNSDSNNSFLETDTFEITAKYRDEICEDPKFLCYSDVNKQFCGKNTTIYNSVQNVEEICKDLEEANICENDIKECIVLVDNSFSESSQKFASSSFENVIIPIPKAIDRDGNQKFLRLPKLMGRKKPNSNEICNICACMDRFARSPGSGFNDYTPPGQNTCVFGEDFKYYYYPISIQNLRNDKNLNQLPPVMLDGNNVKHENILVAKTEDDLSAVKLYNLLTSDGISETLTLNFIMNVLYKNDKQVAKDLSAYLEKQSTKSGSKSRFGVTTPVGSKKCQSFMLLIIVIILFFLFK